MSLTVSTNVLSGPTPLVLEEHQIEAVDAVLEAWSVADRTMIVMACGTGKTIVGFAATREAVKARKAANIGIFVPSLGLIKQTILTWRTFQPWGTRFRVIAACSDAGVEADDIPPDEIPATVTTNADDLAGFIGDSPSDAINVIFSTYHSAGVVADALNQLRRFLDIGIADEAHNTAGSVDKSFGLMLNDEILPIHKRLFMTATPRIVRRGQGKSVSMDDAAIYGNPAYTLSFRKAVERGIICDWEVLISVVTRDDAAAYGLDRAVHGLSGARLQEAAGRAAIAKAIESVGITKAISFHNTILAARDFATAELSNRRAMPGFSIYHVNGADKAGRHKAMLAFAAAKKSLVSNARCLTEGVDIPAVDLVAFLGRKTSKIDIIQAIGRVLRKAPSKTKGYILLPVLLDPRMGQAAEDALANSDLTLVWEVLSAMRDNDELFAENIRKEGRDFDDLGRTNILSPDWMKIIGDVDLEAIRKGIEVIAVDELLFPFDHGYRRLVEFIRKTGHARVSSSHIEPDGFRLGNWIFNRRTEYRQNQLAPDRIAALEALPGWVWSVHDNSWENGYTALKSFVEREGHARVHKTHVEDSGFKLGNWVSNRRHEFAMSELAADRIAALEALPGWVWDTRDDRWENGYIALKGFIEREGHARVVNLHIEPDGFRLGNWISSRRQEYRSEQLTADRIAALEALPGWVWSVRDDSWENGYTALKSFVEREGHARVQRNYIEPDGFKLDIWVSTHRRKYTEGRLSSDHIAALEALPGWVWNVREDHWENGYTALKGFIEREGHANVQISHVEDSGFKLGSWVRNRRQNYSYGRLTADRIAALEALPGWVWGTRDKIIENAWANGMAALLEFIEREGHARVPDKFIDPNGFNLGNWVGTRRKDYQAGKVSAERIAALEALPGWVWSAKNSK